MAVKALGKMAQVRAGSAAFCCAVLALLAISRDALAQTTNPSSAQNPYWGSVTAQKLTDETIRLSLDDAIARGLQNNLGLKEAENNELSLKGERNQALQLFLPTITVSGGTGVFQHNLAAQGFGPSTVSKFGSLFPNGMTPMGISEITKDDLTQGSINFSQILFSGPVIAGWRAAGAAIQVAHFEKTRARGEVVQQVATAYLHAIAARSEVDNAVELQKADQVALDQAHAAHEAGTAANLDELRAKVQLQAQQQQVIAAQNTLDKDLILLKREIGLDPGQNLQLTDPAPYSELAARTPQEVCVVAYQNRQDYQVLQNQLVEVRAIHNVYKYQRLPTLAFGGFWGTDTVNGSGTHGNFVAAGQLTFPIFKEAKLRGDEDAAQAQLSAVSYQLADTRVHIEQQVRDALLDVGAAHQLVEVARSNVELAKQELSDETDRVNNGVDDNLPLVQAQSSVASAESSVVESLYQYNVAKLGLARAAGVLETQYRDYIGR